MIKKFKFLIIPTIFSLLGIEIFSTIFLKLKLIPDVYRANGVSKPIHITYQGLEWRQDKEPFGRWHKKNYESKHVRTCFDIKYISNNIGARDTLDYDNSFKKNSIIFLGDSFVEGYGLDQDETVTFQLEKITKRKVFNLASSQTGPLNYYLTYKQFGNQLPHNTLIVGLLAANDFIENDSNFIDHYGKKTYRPYYDINNLSNEKIIYPNNSKPVESFTRNSFKKFIFAQSIRLGTIRLYKNIQMLRNYPEVGKETITPYYRHSVKQEDAVIYYIKKIYELAKKNGVKNIIVFGIPSAIEYEVLNSEYSSRNLSRWEEKLIDITKNKNDFFYVDGFKIIESKKWDESYTKLYLSCDPHWSPKGAELSAQLLKETLKILDIKKLSK